LSGGRRKGRCGGQTPWERPEVDKTRESVQARWKVRMAKQKLEFMAYEHLRVRPAAYEFYNVLCVEKKSDGRMYRRGAGRAVKAI